MAERRPVVYINGRLTELPAADSLPGVGGGSKTLSRFRARDNYPPATGFATLGTRSTVLLLEANDTDREAVQWTDVIPDGANLSSGATHYVHWAAKTATSGAARIGARVAKLTGNDLDSITWETAAEITTTTNGTSGVPNISALTVTDWGSIAPGDLVLFEAYRDATNTGEDTMSGESQILAVEVRQIA